MAKSLSDLYFKFIESLDNVGNTANSELSSFNFTDDDEDVAKESIAYYKMQLDGLREQLNRVENKAKENFGWK